MTRFKWLLTFFGVLLGLGCVLGVLPVKLWVAGRIKGSLAREGFPNTDLTVTHIGFRTFDARDVTLGRTAPLHLKNVTLRYALLDLLEGHPVDTLDLTGLIVTMTQTDGAWSVSGLDAAQPESSESWSVPVTTEAVSRIPFNALNVSESELRIATPSWRSDVPIDMRWQTTPVPTLSYSAPKALITLDAGPLTFGKSSLELSLNQASLAWQGFWQIASIDVPFLSPSPPGLKASGTVSLTSDSLRFEGNVDTPDHATVLAFAFHYFFRGMSEKGEPSNLTILHASTPFFDGTASVGRVTIPLGVESSIKGDLTISHVSANALLQSLTGAKTTATGFISGVLPLEYAKDGGTLIHDATLSSEAPGVIQLAADVIPGDNPNVAFVRTVLSNFHYTRLALTVTTDESRHVKAVLNLEGRNPDVSNGRSVKLSVNLTGDILGLIQQNLLLLSNPQKFLERSRHENK